MKNVISAIPTPNLRHPPVIGHLPVSMATKSKWPPLPPLPSRVYNRVPGLQHPERQYHLLRHHVSRLKKRKSSLHFFKTHLHFRFRLNKFLFFHVFVGFFSVTLYYFLLILILVWCRQETGKIISYRFFHRTFKNICTIFVFTPLR